MGTAIANETSGKLLSNQIVTDLRSKSGSGRKWRQPEAITGVQTMSPTLLNISPTFLQIPTDFVSIAIYFVFPSRNSYFQMYLYAHIVKI